MCVRLIRPLVLLVAVYIAGCDSSQQSNPTPAAPIKTNPVDTPVSQPIRLPSLTIPPYTLTQDAQTPTGVGNNDDTTLSTADLRLHYYTTTAVSYVDILVEYGELQYTFFMDSDGRCAQWKKPEPCWTNHDLARMGKVLSQEDLDNLSAVVLENKVLTLEKDVYGADEKRRNTSESYAVFLYNQERNFTYYPAPLAEPKPEALARLETALIQYVRDLEAETYYPSEEGVDEAAASPAPPAKGED